MRAITSHCKEDPIYVETARPHSQFPHSCICERFTYSQKRIGPPICCSKYRQTIWGIYCVNRSQIQYMNVELGTRPHSLISGNICFEFSVQCMDISYWIEGLLQRAATKSSPAVWVTSRWGSTQRGTSCQKVLIPAVTRC